MFKRIPIRFLTFALAMVSGISQGSPLPAQPETPTCERLFRGASDASAAVALDGRHFVVADDETNVLRIYAYENESLPVATANLDAFLDSDPKHPEADIEGATRVGDRIYWITSHGRNKDGKMRPGRYRFFATQVKMTRQLPSLIPSGKAYRRLAHDLLKEPWVAGFGLEQATGFGQMGLSKKELKRMAPKREGLNIETLAATPDGQTLYIGFRNPRPTLPDTRRPGALVVPLLNPSAVIDEGARAIFGAPLLWDLGGLGLRSMDYLPSRQSYYLIAGPHESRADFELYRWTGKPDNSPVFVRALFPDREDFTPEALFETGDDGRVFVLSDDGSLEVTVDDPSQCLEGELIDNDKCLNKHLADDTMKTFKAAWIDPADTSKGNTNNDACR